MNVVGIVIVVIIIIVSIFILTYVAHERGSSMCAGCHGDCANCESKKKAEQKEGKRNEE